MERGIAILDAARLMMRVKMKEKIRYVDINEIINVFKRFDFVHDCTIKADGERYKVVIWPKKIHWSLDYVCYNMHEVSKMLDGERIRKDIRESIINDNNEWLKMQLKKRWFIGEMPENLREFYDRIGKGWIAKHIRVKPTLP